MSILNNIYIKAILIFTLNFFDILFCSQTIELPHQQGKLLPYKYTPWQKPQNYNHQKPNIVGVESLNERFGRCYLHAIAEDLEIMGKACSLLKLSHSQDLIIECNIMQYYEQVEHPAAGNLAVYTDNNGIITHFARVKDKNPNTDLQQCIVTFKGGIHPFIYKDDIFNNEYGDTVSFYTKKPHYNNQSIIHALQASIAQSADIKQRLKHAKYILLALTKGDNIINEFYNINRHTYSSLYVNTWMILKDAIGLCVDCSYTNKTTPLMIATARNDLAMMQLFLEMGANVYAQNKDGNTPFTIAQIYQHPQAINLLLQYPSLRLFKQPAINNPD